MDKVSLVFREMSLGHKRNTITYIMKLIGTTFSLFTLTYWFPRLITVSDIEKPISDNDLLVLSTSISPLYYLYIFEIIYKTSIGFRLWAHHIITIVLTYIVTAMLWETRNPAAVYPMILIYSAVTDQSAYVGLIRYRLKLPCYNWFMFTCIIGGIIKTVVFVMGWVVLKYAIIDVDFVDSGIWKDSIIWLVAVSNICLYFIQMYVTNIYWSLGMKSKRSFQDKKIVHCRDVQNPV